MCKLPDTAVVAGYWTEAVLLGLLTLSSTGLDCGISAAAGGPEGLFCCFKAARCAHLAGQCRRWVQVPPSSLFRAGRGVSAVGMDLCCSACSEQAAPEGCRWALQHAVQRVMWI